MLNNKLNYDLNVIKKNSELIDADTIHLLIQNEVENGFFETYTEALASYFEEHEIELSGVRDVKKYISPTLKGLITKEALEHSLLTEEKKSKNYIEDFF